MWISKSKSLTGDIDKKTVTITEFDNDIQFSLGGLHGAHKWKKRIENVKVLDVASMYPSIIINLQVLGPATSLYKELKDKRIKVKHSDKALSDALKLVLNSVYGNLKNQYSLLNNPNASITVCTYGQIALYTLCKALSQVADIININTDGVIFSTDTDDYKKIAKEWEKEFNLTLEEDTYDLFIQKDVNNYIAVKGEYSKFRGAESIKCKGGDVSRYSHDSLFSNNNTRILDIALVDHLVYGKDVLDTLLENLDRPRLYQYILQAGSTFEGTFDDKGNQYNKINRVFATKKGDLVLQKRRYDGALIRFPDAPERMYLWNDDCDSIENFNRIIDLNHYYQIIKSRLERWK
ncbi:MAG: hypothetical protein K0M69_11360 [Youngiibacter sp.]|nr:hypothetical protein [Youngiibacter sp.]